MAERLITWIILGGLAGLFIAGCKPISANRSQGAAQNNQTQVIDAEFAKFSSEISQGGGAEIGALVVAGLFDSQRKLMAHFGDRGMLAETSGRCLIVSGSDWVEGDVEGKPQFGIITGALTIVYTKDINYRPTDCTRLFKEAFGPKYENGLAESYVSYYSYTY